MYMYKTGKVEGQEVADIHLDTGCSRTMVRRNLVAMEKVIVGKVVKITCAHGDTKLHPLALVEVELDGAHIQVEAALSEELPACVCFVGNRCSRVNPFDKCNRIKHQLSKSRASDGGEDKSQSQAAAGRRAY